MAFLGKRVEDIKLVYSALVETTHGMKFVGKHPKCLQMPFDDDTYYGEKSMRIAYIDSECSNPMKRAILTAYGHLTSMGYELVKVVETLPLIEEIFETTIALYFNMNLLANKGFLSKHEEHI